MCSHCSNSASDSSSLLRCDECFAHFHTHCQGAASPAVKDMPWYCAACSPRHSLGTCWIPLGDVGVRDGVLAVMPKSMDLPRFFK